MLNPSLLGPGMSEECDMIFHLFPVLCYLAIYYLGVGLFLFLDQTATNQPFWYKKCLCTNVIALLIVFIVRENKSKFLYLY